MPPTEIALAIHLVDPQFGQAIRFLRTSNVRWQPKQVAKLIYKVLFRLIEGQICADLAYLSHGTRCPSL